MTFNVTVTPALYAALMMAFEIVLRKVLESAAGKTPEELEAINREWEQNRAGFETWLLDVMTKPNV